MVVKNAENIGRRIAAKTFRHADLSQQCCKCGKFHPGRILATLTRSDTLQGIFARHLYQSAGTVIKKSHRSVWTQMQSSRIL